MRPRHARFPLVHSSDYVMNLLQCVCDLQTHTHIHTHTHTHKHTHTQTHTQDFVDLDGNLAALWRIKYDDERLGEEDLDEQEVLEAMSLFAKNFQLSKPKVKTKKSPNKNPKQEAEASTVEKIDDDALAEVVLRALQGLPLPLSGACAPAGSSIEGGSGKTEDSGEEGAGGLGQFLLPVYVDGEDDSIDIGWDMTAQEKLRVAEDKMARSLLQILDKHDTGNEHNDMPKMLALQMQQTRQSLRAWAKCKRCKHTVWGDGTRPLHPMVIVEPILEPGESAVRQTDDELRGKGGHASDQRAEVPRSEPRSQEQLGAEKAMRLAASLNQNPRRSVCLAESKKPALTLGPRLPAAPGPSVDDIESSDEDLPLAHKLDPNKTQTVRQTSKSLGNRDSSDQNMPLAQKKLMPKPHGSLIVTTTDGTNVSRQKSDKTFSKRDHSMQESEGTDHEAHLSVEELARREKRTRFRLAALPCGSNSNEEPELPAMSTAIDAKNTPPPAHRKKDQSPSGPSSSVTATATAPAYKRVRVSCGTPGAVSAPRCSWVRDLEQERAKRESEAKMGAFKRDLPRKGDGEEDQHFKQKGSGGGEEVLGTNQLLTSAHAGNLESCAAMAAGGADDRADLGETQDVDFENASFLQESNPGVLVGTSERKRLACGLREDDAGCDGGQEGGGGGGGGAGGGSGSGGSAGGSAYRVNGPCACKSGKLFVDCHGAKYGFIPAQL
jgi:hypothetical protein